jgi:hypothetical protein
LYRRHPVVARPGKLIRWLVLVLIAATLFPALALADGDPASDVLSFGPLFDPPDAHTSPEQEARLEALINDVNARGYRLKVALVASSGDLGTATEYWEDASGYASKYLGIELSQIFRGGTLLVVMPQTDALYDPVPQKDIPPGDTTAMLGLPPAGSNLAASASGIVRRLATGNGIALPRRLAFTVPTAPRRPRSAAPPVGFVVGLVAAAAAWAISLRVRPFRRKALP